MIPSSTHTTRQTDAATLPLQSAQTEPGTPQPLGLLTHTRNTPWTSRTLPAAYANTLRFRSLHAEHADLPPSDTSVPTAEIFTNPDLLFPVLDTLYASLQAGLPSGMGEKIDDPAALREAIQVFADNLEVIQPGAEAVQHAREALRSFQHATALDTRTHEDAVAGLTQLVNELKDRPQPIPGLLEALRDMQSVCQALADGQAVTGARFEQSLELLARLAQTPSDPELTATLREARAALLALPDRAPAGSAALALQQCVDTQTLAQSQPIHARHLATAHDMLSPDRAGPIHSSDALRKEAGHLSALNTLTLFQCDHRATSALEKAGSALNTFADIRALQETLLCVQQRETEVAIKTISRLNQGTHAMMQDGLSALLPSAMRVDRCLPFVEPWQEPLLWSSCWLSNKKLLDQAKTVSSRFTKKFAEITATTPIHQEGKELGDVLFDDAVSNRSSRLLHLLNGTNASGSPEHAYKRWRTAMHNRHLDAQDKIDFTRQLYRNRQMLAPEKLGRKWRSYKLRTSDLECALRALVQLPKDGELAAFRQEELTKWRKVIHERHLPSVFGDLYVSTRPETSPARLNWSIIIGSDEAASAEIQAYLAAHRTLPDINFLLKAAAFARKPECVALLLLIGHYPDPLALPAMLQSFMGTVIQNAVYRPRDADHTAMLQVIKHMVNAGMSATHTDHVGFNLLHEIAYVNSDAPLNSEAIVHQLDLIDLLVEKGTDLNAINAFGRTPLELRFETLHAAKAPLAGDAVIARLRQHGASPEQAIQRLKEANRTIPRNTRDRKWKIEENLRLIKVISRFQAAEQAQPTLTDTSPATAQHW